MFARILPGMGRRMVPAPEVLFRPMVQRDANKLAKRPVQSVVFGFARE
jgi:hypothetical protein